MNNKARGFFGERPLPEFVVDPQALRRRTRLLEPGRPGFVGRRTIQRGFQPLPIGRRHRRYHRAVY